MSVEQDSLGLWMESREFYQVERRAGVERNSRNPHEGMLAAGGGFKALRGRLVAMELDAGTRDPITGRQDGRRRFVYEQQYGSDEWRQPRGELGCASHGDEARALAVHHETHRVRAGVHGRVHVLLTREAADLDAGAAAQRVGAVHGSQSYAAVRVGRFHSGL